MKRSIAAVLMFSASMLCAGAIPAQAAPPGTPSPDDMIKALAAPVSPDDQSTSRNFHRAQRNPTEDNGIDKPASAGGGSSVGNGSPVARTEPRREIGVPLLFDLASAKLRPESDDTLANIAKALQSPTLKDAKILIEGHTDASGGAEKNLALSEDRAKSVKDYLVQNGGVDASRLTTVGKGQSDPANRANPLAPENRRVVLVNITDN